MEAYTVRNQSQYIQSEAPMGVLPAVRGYKLSGIDFRVRAVSGIDSTSVFNCMCNLGNSETTLLKCGFVFFLHL